MPNTSSKTIRSYKHETNKYKSMKTINSSSSIPSTSQEITITTHTTSIREAIQQQQKSNLHKTFTILQQISPTTIHYKTITNLQHSSSTTIHSKTIQPSRYHYCHNLHTRFQHFQDHSFMHQDTTHRKYITYQFYYHTYHNTTLHRSKKTEDTG